MTNKQINKHAETPQPISDILEQYNIPATNLHYILHNLFRGLKPIRRKYKLQQGQTVVKKEG